MLKLHDFFSGEMGKCWRESDHGSQGFKGTNGFKPSFQDCQKITKPNLLRGQDNFMDLSEDFALVLWKRIDAIHYPERYSNIHVYNI